MKKNGCSKNGISEQIIILHNYRNNEKYMRIRKGNIKYNIPILFIYRVIQKYSLYYKYSTIVVSLKSSVFSKLLAYHWKE